MQQRPIIAWALETQKGTRLLCPSCFDSHRDDQFVGPDEAFGMEREDLENGDECEACQETLRAKGQ